MSNELTPTMSALRARYLDDPGASLPALADEYGYDIEIVQSVAEKGDWVSAKREYLASKYETKNAQYREMASEKRLPMVERQLEIVEKLQAQILLFLDSGLASESSAELRRLSETVTSVTGTLHNLLGVKEALTTEKSKNGDTNLFFIPTSAPLKRVGNPTSS